MKKKLNLISESFTPVQQRLATSGFEKALAKIERETIGAHWNRRQLDMLDILGAWEIEDPEQKSPERPTVTIFEETFEDELGVTKQSIQTDVKGLMDAGILDKVLKTDSKKSKIVVLTNKGFAEWSAYSNERVALILAVNGQIVNEGATPKSWRSRVSDWMMYFSGPSSKAAAIGLVAVTLSFSAGATKANPYSLGDADSFESSIHLFDADSAAFENLSIISSGVILTAGREELYDKLLPRSYDALGDTTDQREMMVTAAILTTDTQPVSIAGYDTSYLPTWGDLTEIYQIDSSKDRLNVLGGDILDAIKIADREGLFDKLLPKGHMSMWQVNNANF